MNKTIIIIFLIIVVCAVGFYCYKHLVFTGSFDKEYTREELTKNFIHNENSFLEVVTFFKNHVPAEKKDVVLFGLGKGNTISLIITPAIVVPSGKNLGGSNLAFGSPQLDAALNVLGWKEETVTLLRDKLAKTNCHWITTTDIYGGKPVKVYSNKKGWGSYTYLIFDSPLSDSLLYIHGKTISNSEFGKRAVLSYSSAL